MIAVIQMVGTRILWLLGKAQANDPTAFMPTGNQGFCYRDPWMTNYAVKVRSREGNFLQWNTKRRLVVENAASANVSPF
jgi:hypothetical protein